jgi:hypothetical protein
MATGPALASVVLARYEAGGVTAGGGDANHFAQDGRGAWFDCVGHGF